MSKHTPPAIQELERQIEALKKELTQKRLELERHPVENYALTTLDGHPVTLAALFEDKSDLLTIHNMGSGCNYCSLWADGFESVAPKLRERCAFVLVSPDSPEKAKAFAATRGWTFPIVSSAGSTYHADLGFADGSSVWPGVSAFRKNADGSIERVSHADFGPGDDFCSVWPFFDLLPDGPAGWEPT